MLVIPLILLFSIISIVKALDNITPQWQNQGQNSTYIPQGKSILLYAQGNDTETGIRWAWLETNETGKWENKTIFYLTTFNDSLTAKNISFDGKENKTVSIKLPKNSNVLSAKVKLKGYIYPNSTLRTEDDTEDAFGWTLGKNPYTGGNSGNGAPYWLSNAHDQNWNTHSGCGYLSFPQPTVNCFYLENYTIPSYAKGAEIKSKGACPRACMIGPWRLYCFDWGANSWVQVNESYYWDTSANKDNEPNWKGENITAIITPEKNWGCWGDNIFNNSHSLLVRTFTYDNIANYSGLYEPNNGTFFESMVTWYNRLDQDSDMEWQYPGVYSGSQTTSDFSKEINSYLLYCLPDAAGYCTIPLMVHSDTAGRIELSELNVTYLAGEYVKNFNNIKGQWVWSNFTWKNDSVPAGTTVGWRIHYQDGEGNRNATDIMNFNVVECVSNEDCDDFNECTQDVCNLTYQCEYPLEADETPCGDQICNACYSGVCQDQTGETGVGCTADCYDCVAGSCDAKTKNNDGSCDDDCDSCVLGTCTNRNQCDTTECSAGYYCDTGGGSCVLANENSQAGENVCEACISGAKHSYLDTPDWSTHFEALTTAYCCDNDVDEYLIENGVGLIGCCDDPSENCVDSGGFCRTEYPTEVTCDGIDNDCDETIDEGCDDDNDDYCDATMTTVGTPAVCPNGGGDCNDTNYDINPGVTEIVDNAQDDDCDGNELCYLDYDDDGYRPDSTSTVVSSDLDCTDPGEAESSDPTGDCNDTDAAVNPGASEICNNQIDDDCDSYIDCQDSNCPTTCTGNCVDSYCNPTTYQWECSADGILCTGNCDYCKKFSETNFTCAANETVCELMYCADCTGSGTSFNCTYDETEDEDCDPFDIATCFNIPDALDFTWDFRDSYCTGLNTCYEGTITHTCDQTTCGAECDEHADCGDKCVGDIRYYSGSCALSSTCSCSWSTEDCDNDDCTTGLTCNGLGTDTIDEDGNDYGCSAGTCSVAGKMDCNGPWTCYSGSECSSQQCGGSDKYCYYNTGYKWGNSYPTTETSCSDGHDNDCDGYTDSLDSDCAPPKPDLVVSTIWASGKTIYYRVNNNANANAGYSYSKLWIDNAYKVSDYVPALNAWSYSNEYFGYSWTCSGLNDRVKVCADVNNNVDESNEGNNCREITIACVQTCQGEGGRCMSGGMGCSIYCRRLGKVGGCAPADPDLGYYPGCSPGNCCCFCG